MNRDELLTKAAMEIDEWQYPDMKFIDLYSAPNYVYGNAKAVADAVSRSPHVDIGMAASKSEWLQRRAELINKPSWDDAPEWAEWLAQSEKGEWEWHQDMPEMISGGWDIPDNDVFHSWEVAQDGAVPDGHDWRQTLERRPDFDESRADAIGENGNDGEHYDEVKHDCGKCGGAYYTPPHEVCPCHGKQERYRDQRGEDWIDEFARTATPEEFRGAMRFTIGKYNRRMGKKDELMNEIRKMRDYCDRWLAYEEDHR